MDALQIVVLSFVQGITEFLPVSSSAHLILVPEIFGWPDQGPSFDIAVHVGTLVAVLLYFRCDLLKMMKAFVRGCLGNGLTQEAKLLWAIGFATIPVGLTGLLLKSFIQGSLRKTSVIVATTLVFALLLWFADWMGKRKRSLADIRWYDVLAIGCGQALSLIPGTSRSGITLTVGLLCGLTRASAARFSFLLSIPVIILAGGLETYTLIQQSTTIHWSVLAWGAVLSGLSGFCCIHIFLKLIEAVGLLPFVLYRLALGVFLYVYFFV